MDCGSVSEHFISKFVIKGNPVYAKVLWQTTKDHLLHMQAFSGELSWSGELSYEMCKAFGENFDENEQQYSKNVKDALKMKIDTYSYDFTIDHESNIAKFSWTRTFVESTATLLHGFVSLKKDEIAATKADIIDFLLDENKNLSLALEKHTNKTKKLECDLNVWENELKKFIDLKDSLETTLYGKFVQLLNTKKRRIQELEEQLDEL